MATTVQFRPQERDLGMVMREVDENLAIFLGIKNVDKDKNDHPLMEDSDEFNDSKGSEPKPEIVQNVADDNFLNLEIDKSDYDWLFTQRDISLLPSEEVEWQESANNQTEMSIGEVISPKSELANTSEESASLSNNSSAAENKRPLSSGDQKPTPRAPTPTGRRPIKSKPSRASTPTSRTSSGPSRAALATSITSSKPMAAQTRSSTPSTSRSATPTCRPTTTSAKSSASDSDRSSSGRKTGPTMSKNPVPSRGASQTVKSRPSKPSEMLSLSHNAPQNLKACLPKRPASASRGRPANHLSSSNGKPRQKSCSPAKVRAPPNGTALKHGNVMLSKSRGYSINGGDDDDVNPVLMGTKMVERVVNMRKLAPPKQDDYVSLDNPRKSSMENSGFGRSLSKKSLDMAIRHMDIRRSIPDNLRPISTALSSSVCGIRSSSSRSSTVSVSESPLTSSSDSSKSSNCVNSYFLDRSQMDRLN